jgi:ABC-type dipeptide/oligopeptide/nickel transport system permease subunit
MDVQTEAVVLTQKRPSVVEFWLRLKRNKLAVVSLFVLIALTIMAIAAPAIAPYDPYATDMTAVIEKPSSGHLLGADDLGRDMLSRIIYGSRISLRVGFLAVAISMAAGTCIGSIAGYFGGTIDNIVMRFMDMLMAFPPILLAIVFMSALGRGIENAILAISIVGVPGFSRIVRGSVLAAKENDYVEAARASGCNDLQIIFVHLLPNILAPIIVNATMSISSAILQTAALGFLGLGVKPPTAEWGSMLATGRGYIFNAPHLITYPGIAISITVLAFNLLGDGLRDALDPRLKQ